METENTPMDDAAVSALPPATGSSTINIGTSERIVSAFGGAALAVWGLRNLNSATGIGMLLSGGYLMVRGISGYCYLSNMIGRNTADVQRQSPAMEIRTTFTINKPRSDVYAFWRKLENLPKFMQHLEKVEELDDKRSTWTAKVPGVGAKVSWQAEITSDISGELISWTSLPGSTVDNAGEVRFRDVAGKGTELAVCISYRLPAGDLGSMAGKLFNPAIERMMRDDIRSFKQLLETGEAAAVRESRTPQAV
ncbi:DUF2892 domain-containing protein [Fulvivirgaceae bacterium PWU4]|uniref:DUF2892 domain-containing protein n=1 Tax=Chryseosolibacter histidini TaxID=2782349 RepID=A0AAP2DR98_9BACT|nr:SRPBCC family protein [Chryseosolibacter histidini]MBT1700069.1 DUF2892 domain-containing protein [Chryseosolibacter histidini]